MAGDCIGKSLEGFFWFLAITTTISVVAIATAIVFIVRWLIS